MRGAAQRNWVLPTLAWPPPRRARYGEAMADANPAVPVLDDLLTDLELLVNTESPSHEVAELTESARVLAKLIEDRTGVAAELVDSPVGPHVWWQGSTDPTAKKVLILGHHDTVFPLGTVAERPFAVADGKATGPGVYDMKAGIVQALHAVVGLDDMTGVEMLFTSDEEVGSGHSRAFLEQRAQACGNVLVLEPSGPGGAVKTGRKGAGTFTVTIDGKAAHAGLEPEAGVNSLVEAAHQVLRINEFGNDALGTTVTPTVAHVGTADNVIPAKAVVKVDARVLDPAEAGRVDADMYALSSQVPGTTISVTGSVHRPPMPESASATLFPLVERVAPGLGGSVVGGASDGNFTAALGVPTLDGLGGVGGGAHADHEWVDVSTMPDRVRLVYGLLAALTA